MDWRTHGELRVRSCRNNRRMVGLPETVKPLELHLLCEQELHKALGINHTCRIKWVHRVGPESLAKGMGFQIQYPATLKFFCDKGPRKFYTSPEEMEKDLGPHPR